MQHFRECSGARCLRAQPLQRWPRELEEPAWGEGAVMATKSCDGHKILWRPQNPPPGIQPGGFCFADVHGDPPGVGAAGGQGLQALFHRGQPQWPVSQLLSVCLSVCQ